MPFSEVARRVEFRGARWRVGPWREGMMVEFTVRIPPWGAYAGCVLVEAPLAFFTNESYVSPFAGLGVVRALQASWGARAGVEG